MQLVTEGEVLQIQNHPMTESASNNRYDGTHELEHAGTLRRPIPKLQTFHCVRSFGSHGLRYRLNPHRQKDYEAVPILEILLDPMRIDAIRHGFSLAFGAALVLPHRIGEFA
jgi:hypothetical protein